ncbi:MAG: hypothetical protein ACK5HU_06730 [Flavobacteriales bacterium]
MNIQATKLEIMQYLLNSNKKSVLAKFKSIIEKEQAKEIVAYTVDGNPLTLVEYQKELEQAEKEIESGDYFTTEELEKEISTWE